MRKFLVFMFVAFAAISIQSCNKDKDDTYSIVGDWYQSKYEGTETTDGISTPFSKTYTIKDSLFVSFYNNGTYRSDSKGDIFEGTWKAEGNTIFLKMEGGERSLTMINENCFIVERVSSSYQFTETYLRK